MTSKQLSNKILEVAKNNRLKDYEVNIILFHSSEDNEEVCFLDISLNNSIAVWQLDSISDTPINVQKLTKESDKYINDLAMRFNITFDETNV